MCLFQICNLKLLMNVSQKQLTSCFSYKENRRKTKLQHVQSGNKLKFNAYFDYDLFIKRDL